MADPNTTNREAVNAVDARNGPEKQRLPATSGITKHVPEADSTIDVDLERPE